MTNAHADPRHERQLGLVNQRRLEDLTVLVEGRGRAVAWLLTDLALLGVGRGQGGIVLRTGRGPVGDADLAGQALLEHEDLGLPFDEAAAERLRRLDAEVRVFPADAVPGRVDVHVLLPDGGADPLRPRPDALVLWGQLGRSAVCVSPRRLDTADHEADVLTPSLEALLAALLAHELVRRTRSVRSTTVAKVWSSVNFHLRGHGLGRAFERREPPALQFRRADGVALTGYPELVSDDEVLVRVPLHEYAPAALLAEAVQVLEPPATVADAPPLAWSPFGPVQIQGDRVVDPPAVGVPELRGRAVAIAGLGALGSWVALLFSVSPTRECRLTLIDMDPRVERHNLNRQVLFTLDDVGEAKAVAARRRLAALNAANEVRAVSGAVDEAVMAAARDGTGQTWEEFAAQPAAIEVVVHGRAERIHRDPRPLIAGELCGSDAIASCFDNARSRWLLNVIGEHAGRVLVNGAAQEMEGRAHRVDPRRGDPCLVCRLGEGIKTDRVRYSCTEAGDVPIQAMVTTGAAVAAVQAIMLLLSLTGRDDGSCNWLRFLGREGRIEGGRSAPRWKDECPAHLLPADGSMRTP